MVAKKWEGLALFWRNGIQVKAGLKSRYHIDAEITGEDGFQWRFTGIYEESQHDKKEATWKLLKTIQHHSDKPWLCAGVFNEVRGRPFATVYG